MAKLRKRQLSPQTGTAAKQTALGKHTNKAIRHSKNAVPAVDARSKLRLCYVKLHPMKIKADGDASGLLARRSVQERTKSEENLVATQILPPLKKCRVRLKRLTMPDTVRAIRYNTANDRLNTENVDTPTILGGGALLDQRNDQDRSHSRRGVKSIIPLAHIPPTTKCEVRLRRIAVTQSPVSGTPLGDTTSRSPKLNSDKENNALAVQRENGLCNEGVKNNLNTPSEARISRGRLSGGETATEEENGAKLLLPVITNKDRRSFNKLSLRKHALQDLVDAIECESDYTANDAVCEEHLNLIREFSTGDADKAADNAEKVANLQVKAKEIRRPHRFFHKHVRTPEPSKRPVYSKANDRSSPENIFDFQSQSQTETHNDPTSDIISRLIREGKVSVATNRKGKGRPIIKRILNGQKRRGPKRMINKRINKKNEKISATEVASNKNLNNDHTMSPTAIAKHTNEVLIPPGSMLNLRNTHINSPDGTFSRLARSVLIQQSTGQGSVSLKRQAEQRKLLEVARKFVSTPLNKNAAPPLCPTNLSPISATSASTSSRIASVGNMSPWRINQNMSLPNVFNFNTNTSNLPSFSSDNIPASPRKQHSITNKTLSTPEPSPTTTPVAPTSSFSSNDSNAENMPPPPPLERTSTTVDTDSNSNIFNLRQFPNPYQGLKHRTPLKGINILEVVILPNINISKVVGKDLNDGSTNEAQGKRSKSPNNKNMSSFEESMAKGDECRIENINNTLPDDTPLTINLSKELRKYHKGRTSSNEAQRKSPNNNNLFGFEEFMTEVDESCAENRNNTLRGDTTHDNNHSLREKLHELKKWRSARDEFAGTSGKRMKPVFDDFENQPKQRSVKEMLCSTMINQPSSTVPVRKYYVDDDDSNCGAAAEPVRPESENTHLFKDLDPETTFDEKASRRTYVRPYRKKRKLRHNFVMFMDSDNSSSEDEESRDNEERRPNEANERDKRPGYKPKLQRKDAQSNIVEMKSFVNDFNSMCKDVEQYELIVE